MANEAQVAKEKMMSELFEAAHEFNYFRKKFNPKKRIDMYNRLYRSASPTEHCM